MQGLCVHAAGRGLDWWSLRIGSHAGCTRALTFSGGDQGPRHGVAGFGGWPVFPHVSFDHPPASARPRSCALCAPAALLHQTTWICKTHLVPVRRRGTAMQVRGLWDIEWWLVSRSQSSPFSPPTPRWQCTGRGTGSGSFVCVCVARRGGTRCSCLFSRRWSSLAAARGLAART